MLTRKKQSHYKPLVLIETTVIYITCTICVRIQFMISLQTALADFLHFIEVTMLSPIFEGQVTDLVS